MAGPIQSSNDIWAFVPEHLRNTSQPLTDAAIEALTAIAKEWEDEAAEAAKQCDVGQADDQYLTGLASDREVQRQPSETDAALRARTTTAPAAVVQHDITTPINVILSAYGATYPYCRIIDSILDCAYIPVDGSGYACFVADDDQTHEAAPDYPERFYSAGVDTTGLLRSCSRPIGAHIFDDGVGRHFEIFVPPPSNSALTDNMLREIANSVTIAVGQGIRWSVWVVSCITGA